MRQQQKFNTIRFPQAFVSAAAREAAFEAASTFGRAERELALPAPLRRPVTQIHADTLTALRVAASLTSEVQ